MKTKDLPLSLIMHAMTILHRQIPSKSLRVFHSPYECRHKTFSRNPELAHFCCYLCAHFIAPGFVVLSPSTLIASCGFSTSLFTSDLTSAYHWKWKYRDKGVKPPPMLLFMFHTVKITGKVSLFGKKKTSHDALFENN